MRNQCLDEGMIQSYLDGELSSNLMEKTTAHLAACDACALALAEAQEESEMLFAALEPEVSLLPVPSEILRERINLAIAAETRNRNFTEPNSSLVRGLFSTITSLFVFNPQYAAGFAAVILAVLIGTIFFISSNRNNNGVAVIGSGYEKTGWRPDMSIPKPEPTKPISSPVQNVPKRIITSTSPKGVRPKEATLPEEKSYLKAIASLKKSIDVQTDLNMRPTLRAEYERNLAVVDKAINETQKQARKNPKDAGAAQLLYASYQSKIDLLNAVSNQNQLYAALRD